MLKNLVKKFRSQSLNETEEAKSGQVMHGTNCVTEEGEQDSGTESDDEAAAGNELDSAAETKSLAVSQTSDYCASEQSLYQPSESYAHSLPPSDTESNSLDSAGCESGIVCDGDGPTKQELLYQRNYSAFKPVTRSMTARCRHVSAAANDHSLPGLQLPDEGAVARSRCFSAEKRKRPSKDCCAGDDDPLSCFPLATAPRDRCCTPRSGIGAPTTVRESMRGKRRSVPQGLRTPTQGDDTGDLEVQELTHSCERSLTLGRTPAAVVSPNAPSNFSFDGGLATRGHPQGFGITGSAMRSSTSQTLTSARRSEPIKLLLPPTVRGGNSSTDSDGWRVSPRKRTKGEVGIPPAPASSPVDVETLNAEGCSNRMRPTLNFDKMREKMTKPKKHGMCQAKSKLRGLGARSSRSSQSLGGVHHAVAAAHDHVHNFRPVQQRNAPEPT